MGYRVMVIGEQDLPAGQGWALIEVNGRTTIFAIKPSAFGVEAMAEGWAAYRMLDRSHTPCRADLPPPARVGLQLLPA